MIALLAYPYLAVPSVRKRYWIFVAANVAVVTLSLAPWTIRNLHALGSPIWSRSNLGLELNLSNNDGASAVWQDNWDSGQFARMHPFMNSAQSRRLREAGEVAYNREQLLAARQWITSHPARFAWLTVQRVYYFWIPAMRRSGQTIALAVVTLLGFLGFSNYARRGGCGWQYFLLVWLFFPLSAYLFQQSGRMRYPIEWISFLFAGCCLTSASRSGLARGLWAWAARMKAAAMIGRWTHTRSWPRKHWRSLCCPYTAGQSNLG
jgi:hypothetical protein